MFAPHLLATLLSFVLATILTIPFSELRLLIIEQILEFIERVVA